MRIRPIPLDNKMAPSTSRLQMQRSQAQEEHLIISLSLYVLMKVMSNPPDKPTCIFLWHMPRSISTCFAKCLGSVDGVQVWHEPYDVAFQTELARTLSEARAVEPQSPSEKTLWDAMMAFRGKPNEYSGGRFMPAEDFTYSWVKSKLEEGEPDKKYILIKDTAYCIHDHLDALPEVPSRHTFIIRHPYRCMTSERKLFMRVKGYRADPSEFVLDPEIIETYFKQDYMHLLWKSVQETGRDRSPVIIDAEDLVNYPEKILPKYLGALGIPYSESYTTWDASEETIKTWKGALEWVVMGKQNRIFDQAFGSSRFLPKSQGLPNREELTPDILGVIDRIMPGYEGMYEQRIRPE